MQAEEKLQEASRLLTLAYGPQKAASKRSPVQELIMTLLSHRTTYMQEKKAYENLISRYSTFDAIRQATVLELTKAIAPVQFPDVKAVYIKECLQEIHAREGHITLDFLHDMPTDQAMAYLLSLKGVGPKTATLLLLFNFQKAVLPVDTHVHRVCSRLGILPHKMSAEKAHNWLLARLPADADLLFSFHKHFFWHGQRICIYSYPRCSKCVLADICAYHQKSKAMEA